MSNENGEDLARKQMRARLGRFTPEKIGNARAARGRARREESTALEQVVQATGDARGERVFRRASGRAALCLFPYRAPPVLRTKKERAPEEARSL
ncbi:MAG TPA: hypothetical protein VGB73_05955 [Pyrinomonadaceae bacterium]